MDYSKFLNDDFDVKEWVNTAFKSNKDSKIENDQYATTLVMKLQMFIQEVNSVVEEASQEVLSSMPRVARDVEALAHDTAALQQQMQMVKTDIQKVEHDTASSMQMLLQLDAVKTRMEAMSQALQEADNWTTLSSDVEEVMQSRDVDAIAAKLMGMQQSLRLLTDVADYEDRCQYLEALKNRLEAIVSPQLVAAFMSSSVESARKYARIFRDVNRTSQLHKYYERCQKSQLVKVWSALADDAETAAADGPGLLSMLAKLYDALVSTWHTQTRWCSQAFEDQREDAVSSGQADMTVSALVVCDVLRESLLALQPPLPTCFAQHLELRDDPMASLVELKEVTDRFVKTMEPLLAESLPDTACSALHIEQFATAIYEPYRPYMSQYGKMESAFLSRHLDGVRLDARETDDTALLLSDSVLLVLAGARATCERCIVLTHSCCFPMLLESLKAYFESYSRDFKRVLMNLREKYRGRQLSAAGTGSKAATSAASTNSDGGEDGSFFQDAFRIIRACGELITKVEELDERVCSCLVASSACCDRVLVAAAAAGTGDRTAKGASTACLSDAARLLLVDEEDRSAFRSLVQRVKDSSSALSPVIESMTHLCEEAHKLTFDVAFGRIAGYVSKVSEKKVWTSTTAGGALTANLPTFSLSPQEYMTKVGQYLLMLPQHLEPFTVEDDPIIVVATKRGHLLYTGERDEFDHVADLWLQSIARGLMHVYCEEILRIPELSANGACQLTTDIDYLCNVLDDLGLPASVSLKTIDKLLKVAPENFAEASETAPQSIASPVRSMRNIRV